jgi:hypothetical protein
MVARAAHAHRGPLVDIFVNESRTAATVGIKQDSYTPDPRIARITAQGVLARQAVVENQVDMGSWLPPWQVFVFWMPKVEHHHTLGGCAATPDNQVGSELMYGGPGLCGRGCRHRLLCSNS